MLGSRENEIQKTKKRLAAKAFLTNISLTGNYKDTGWCLEYTKQEQHNLINGNKDHGKEGCHHHHHHYTSRNSEAAHLLDGPPPPLSISTENGTENYDFTHNDLNINNVPEGYGIPTTRIRSNTGSSELSFRSRNRRFISETDGVYHPKHCHFSSAESVEHGVRARQISTSNVSECSSSHPKELKMLNLRDNPLPTIRDERLIIMLSKRTPFLVFSALPYARNPRYTRF